MSAKNSREREGEALLARNMRDIGNEEGSFEFR